MNLLCFYDFCRRIICFFIEVGKDHITVISALINNHVELMESVLTFSHEYMLLFVEQICEADVHYKICTVSRMNLLHVLIQN